MIIFLLRVVKERISKFKQKINSIEENNMEWLWHVNNYDKCMLINVNK